MKPGLGTSDAFVALAVRAEKAGLELCLSTKNARLHALFLRKPHPKNPRKGEVVGTVSVPNGDVEFAARALDRAWKS